MQVRLCRLSPVWPPWILTYAPVGWNSPNCGTCWQLKYKNNTINVLAIDHARSGFNIALAAMNKLTNNQAEHLGIVQATVTEVAPSNCGL